MQTQPGDRWLLCSDGLSGVVEAHMQKVPAQGVPPGRTADLLLKQALDGGAPDNVTMVIVDVGGAHPAFFAAATIVGSAANPVGIEIPAARAGRASWLHPQRGAANEPAPCCQLRTRSLLRCSRFRVSSQRPGMSSSASSTTRIQS